MRARYKHSHPLQKQENKFQMKKVREAHHHKAQLIKQRKQVLPTFDMLMHLLRDEVTLDLPIEHEPFPAPIPCRLSDPIRKRGVVQSLLCFTLLLLWIRQAMGVEHVIFGDTRMPESLGSNSFFATRPPSTRSKSFHSKPIKGCERFEVVKGNPRHSDTTTLLIGEVHGKHNADVLNCVKGFGKLKNTKPIVLFETFLRGEYAACEESSVLVIPPVEGIDYSQVSNDCRGWNHIEYDIDTQNDWQVESFNALSDHFKNATRNMATKQEKLEYIQSKIPVCLEHHKIYEQQHRDNFDRYQKTHPAADLEHFHSGAKKSRIGAAITRTVIQKILDAFNNTAHLEDALNQVKLSLPEGMTKRLMSVKRTLATPNRSLTKSIHATKGQVTVAIAGTAHVDESLAGTFSSTKKQAKARRAVQKLYASLEENSFAVLKHEDVADVVKKRFVP